MVTLSSITYSIKSLFSIAYRYERDWSTVSVQYFMIPSIK